MSDFGEAAGKVGRLKKELDARAEKALNSSMNDVEDELERQISLNDSNATGHLKGHINTIPGTKDRPNQIASRMIVGPDYWRFLEYGTGIYTSRGYSAASPGAPYHAILRWVRAKGITPRPDGPADTQEEVAAAIANSISTGTQSHPFVRPVWRGPKGRDYVIDLVGRAMQRAVDRAF
jgi:HK97 gp10 family phage protein